VASPSNRGGLPTQRAADAVVMTPPSRSRRRIVSRHFLRRRARSAERQAQHAHPGAPEGRYVVEPAARGPYRWYVVERR
jgi:hypothetical protein